MFIEHAYVAFRFDRHDRGSSRDGIDAFGRVSWTVHDTDVKFIEDRTVTLLGLLDVDGPFGIIRGSNQILQTRLLVKHAETFIRGLLLKSNDELPRQLDVSHDSESWFPQRKSPVPIERQMAGKLRA